MPLDINDEFIDVAKFNFGYTCEQVYDKPAQNGLYPNVFVCDLISTNNVHEYSYLIQYEEICKFRDKYLATIYHNDSIICSQTQN